MLTNTSWLELIALEKAGKVHVWTFFLNCNFSMNILLLYMLHFHIICVYGCMHPWILRACVQPTTRGHETLSPGHDMAIALMKSWLPLLTPKGLPMTGPAGWYLVIDEEGTHRTCILIAGSWSLWEEKSSLSSVNHRGVTHDPVGSFIIKATRTLPVKLRESYERNKTEKSW